LCERARCHESHHAYRELEGRLSELADLVAVPSNNVPLTLKLLLGQRFELERFLVELGDDKYLRSRAADLFSEGEGTGVTWSRLIQEGHFSGPPPLLADVPKGDNTAEERSDAVEQTRQMLARLIAAKETEDLPLRGRRELKQKALLLVLPVIFAATVALGVAIGNVKEGKGDILLAACAGATGAALGRLFKLRDDVNLGVQIREFVQFFVGQVVVGAVAGLLVYLVVTAGFIRPGGGTSGLAAFAFVAGFSEAVFLGLVGRIGQTLTGVGNQRTRS
jgi:hypothetical protein